MFRNHPFLLAKRVPLAIQKHQKIYIGIRTRIATRFRSVKDDRSVWYYLVQQVSDSFYDFRTIHRFSFFCGKNTKVCSMLNPGTDYSSNLQVNGTGSTV